MSDYDEVKKDMATKLKNEDVSVINYTISESMARKILMTPPAILSRSEARHDKDTVEHAAFILDSRQ
ncbi:hypothetical protein JOD43_003901 [Pullulanibacillus pueri]|uniref:Uncharacterized protein n=1 Tax=Pullulanibacillus pueri TaxID=1437324 RepID=A0A8J2ZXY0_9BACL|nr:hypothetical protein [Pullulanibacillus pueri]MBM7683721.1 hypothetical protein [Pullulanibacillus pueri]GGH85165.1 hypothetical protein GCM10007096_29920 [Pullulanibacillus pueri]